MAQASKQQGFTLIEIMIVMVIIGVLSALSLPSYTAYTLKANRTDGWTMMNEIMQAQERFVVDNDVYTVNLTQMGYLASQPSIDGYYIITAEGCTVGPISECVRLRATALLEQRADDNGNSGNMTLNSRGSKIGWQ